MAEEDDIGDLVDPDSTDVFLRTPGGRPVAASDSGPVARGRSGREVGELADQLLLDEVMPHFQRGEHPLRRLHIAHSAQPDEAFQRRRGEFRYRAGSMLGLPTPRAMDVLRIEHISEVARVGHALFGPVRVAPDATQAGESDEIISLTHQSDRLAISSTGIPGGNEQAPSCWFRVTSGRGEHWFEYGEGGDIRDVTGEILVVSADDASDDEILEDSRRLQFVPLDADHPSQELIRLVGEHVDLKRFQQQFVRGGVTPLIELPPFPTLQDRGGLVRVQYGEGEHEWLYCPRETFHRQNERWWLRDNHPDLEEVLDTDEQRRKDGFIVRVERLEAGERLVCRIHTPAVSVEALDVSIGIRAGQLDVQSLTGGCGEGDQVFDALVKALHNVLARFIAGCEGVKMADQKLLQGLALKLLDRPERGTLASALPTRAENINSRSDGVNFSVSVTSFGWVTVDIRGGAGAYSVTVNHQGREFSEQLKEHIKAAVLHGLAQVLAGQQPQASAQRHERSKQWSAVANRFGRFGVPLHDADLRLEYVQTPDPVTGTSMASRAEIRRIA
ncbi:MAG: hypothetical protein Q8P95_05380 [bacterium]|nr:hypothetical protein [bacterium]